MSTHREEHQWALGTLSMSLQLWDSACLFLLLGVRNYLKEALVSIITVHAEVPQNDRICNTLWAADYSQTSRQQPNASLYLVSSLDNVFFFDRRLCYNDADINSVSLQHVSLLCIMCSQMAGFCLSCFLNIGLYYCPPCQCETSFAFDHSLSLTNTQVFTISKELVPRILSKIVEAVAEEMCRLMHCVPSFSKNGAMQV